MRRIIIASLVVLTQACSPGSITFSGVGPARLDAPPAPFVEAYLDAETCSGLHGDVARVSWFAVDGNPDFRMVAGHPELRQARGTFFKANGDWFAGLWQPEHIIYVGTWYVAHPDEKLSYEVVKHESLHDLLQVEGHHQPVWEQCDILMSIPSVWENTDD